MTQYGAFKSLFGAKRAPYLEAHQKGALRSQRVKAKVLLTQNKQTKNKQLVGFETHVKRKQSINKETLLVCYV